MYCYCLKGRKAHSPDDFYECNPKMCPAGGLVHKKCAELIGEYDQTWMCKFCEKMPANENMLKQLKLNPKLPNASERVYRINKRMSRK